MIEGKLYISAFMLMHWYEVLLRELSQQTFARREHSSCCTQHWDMARIHTETQMLLSCQYQ